MVVIDEQGRLFGLVNLVDALVVLVVLAILVAGVTFVIGGDSDTPTSDTAVRYATLDLGVQPAYVATHISEGDAVQPDNVENMTITDVYSLKTGDGRHLYTRVRINGMIHDETVTYDGDPLRVGRNLSLTTPAYATSGTITAVDATTPDLPVGETDVLLRTTLPADAVDAMRTGDEYRIDGRTVATVQSVMAHKTDTPGQVRAYVGVTYRTYRTNDGPQFAGTHVREGVTLPLETDATAFDGEVVRVGATEPRGTEATRTVRLEIENTDPDLGDALRTGMTERVRGETVVELTDIAVEPSTMVVTSQDGNVYRREHPVEEDVTLTADLRVRETNAGLQFKGAPLRHGRTVFLDFGTVTVEATVVSVE
ncbi:DUF4330 family protein [Salinigranum salinum]|uniref:DUF4330 family protein n=1 Tax=Salinigranum salinum TaxID=1364937 RepID=UPI001260C2B1|nr:DUF4330 family protein [Salinigranum salinum]